MGNSSGRQSPIVPVEPPTPVPPSGPPSSRVGGSPAPARSVSSKGSAGVGASPPPLSKASGGAPHALAFDVSFTPRTPAQKPPLGRFRRGGPRCGPDSCAAAGGSDDDDDRRAGGEGGEDEEEGVAQSAMSNWTEGSAGVYSSEELDALFGGHVGEKLQEKRWQTRKDALDTIRLFLSNRCESQHSPRAAARSSLAAAEGEKDDDDSVSRATLFVVHSFLQDQVTPVYFAAADLMRGFLETHGPLVRRLDLRGALVPIAEVLTRKMGDSNSRINREAALSLLALARTDESFCLPVIVQCLQREDIPVHPRLQILRLMIPISRLRPSTGLPLGLVLRVCLPSLEIADDRTRRDAVGAIVDCYKLKGDVISKHLSSVRPVMLKILQRKFAEFDAAQSGQGGEDAAEGPSRSPQEPPPTSSRSTLPPIGSGGSKPSGLLAAGRNTSSAPTQTPFDSLPPLSERPLALLSVSTKRQVPFSPLDNDDERLMDDILGL